MFPSYPIVKFHVYLLLGETTVKKLSDRQIPSYSLIVSTWGALTSKDTRVCVLVRSIHGCLRLGVVLIASTDTPGNAWQYVFEVHI